MSRETLRFALTKKALAKQLMRAGSPKREAEAVVARLPWVVQWRKLPDHVRSEIAWKVGTRTGGRHDG